MSYSRLITLNIIFIALLIKFWSILIEMIQTDIYYIPANLSGKIEDTNYDISEVIKFHQQVSDSLDKIRSTLFFKVFKVNINSECNFWTQNLICNYRTCSVCQCDEGEIPLPWKQDSENDELNKNIGELFYKWVEKYNYSSSNWLVENENDSKKWVYVDLLKNPEAYTGYMGQHIWNAIYLENCFYDKLDQLCKEDKLLFKIISGLHSNINIHLSMNYLDIVNNLTFWNISMYYERVGKHEDRINNMFYLYTLLSRALLKVEKYIQNYKIYTANDYEDENTKLYIRKLYDSINSNQNCFDLYENRTNITENIENSKKLNLLKLRFRNISEIIDCVSCQKCKLHGKLQIYGLATMLKILFKETDNFKIKRNEIIAFVNLVAKVGRAINGFLEFNKLLKHNNYYSICIKGFMMFLLSMLLLIVNYLYINYGFKKDYLKSKVNKFNKSDEVKKICENQQEN